MLVNSGCGGKSYTLGSIIEAATLPTPPVNELPQPLATIVFHYSPTLDYARIRLSWHLPRADHMAGARPPRSIRAARDHTLMGASAVQIEPWQRAAGTAVSLLER